MDKYISQLKSFTIVNKNEGLQTQSITFKDNEDNIHMLIRNRMSSDSCSIYTSLNGESINTTIPKSYFDLYWKQ
jgi:hypothetical protein